MKGLGGKPAKRKALTAIVRPQLGIMPVWHLHRWATSQDIIGLHHAKTVYV